MKKVFCLLLTLTLVFAFASCKKNGGKTDKRSTNSTETTDNYRPGDWVTDASGMIQTTKIPVLITDKNGEAMTKTVTDKDGSTRYEAVTTYAYDIQTYPAREGETLPTQALPQTVPVGNTLPSQNKAWPSDKFMASMPKAADKVDYLSETKNEDGNCVSISINDYSYEQFRKYLKTLTDAGFAQSYGNPDFPDQPTDGQAYYYGMVAKGLYITVAFYTDKAPYRECDLNITVADYDVGGIYKTLKGQG